MKNHLGPRLHKDGHDDVGILVWDHNRDIIVDRVALFTTIKKLLNMFGEQAFIGMSVKPLKCRSGT